MSPDAPFRCRPRTARSVTRTLLASAVSVALALGGATLVLGCGGTMTGDAGSGGATGAATAAASMPGMATMTPNAATDPAPETADAQPATEAPVLTGVAEIMSHHHGMTTAQMDAMWMNRPAYVRDNGSAVSEAYAFALSMPGPLETMPCYCGCVAMDHRSNLDCFFKARNNEADPLQFEEHASFCGICIDTALLTKHRLAEGATLAQIRAEVDATIGNNGVEGTHTALPPTA